MDEDRGEPTGLLKARPRRGARESHLASRTRRGSAGPGRAPRRTAPLTIGLILRPFRGFVDRRSRRIPEAGFRSGRPLREDFFLVTLSVLAVETSPLS